MYGALTFLLVAHAFSSVGSSACPSAPSGDIEDIVLPTYAEGVFSPVWVDGAGMYKSCEKMTFIFGVGVCVTKKAWSARAKCDHIAHVVAELLDNDADGVANDPKVVAYMAANQMFMFVPYDEDDADSASYPGGHGQMTGVWEAFPNCCDVPSNRGASDTDRSSWAAVIGNTPGGTGCDTNRDATTEEVHHLIGEAAARVFPDIWATTANSEAGKAILALNGNCGWGHSDDYINPSGANSACTGTYAYDDETCDESCAIMEGIYWSSITWIGGLYTTQRANIVDNEWLMTVPDTRMDALPTGASNAKTLQEASPTLYALISDTTSAGHRWLPSIMPNGEYHVTAAGAEATSGTYPGDIGGGGGCESDASDECVSEASGGEASSCADVKEGGMCDDSEAQKLCCKTCDADSGDECKKPEDCGEAADQYCGYDCMEGECMMWCQGGEQPPPPMGCVTSKDCPGEEQCHCEPHSKVRRRLLFAAGRMQKCSCGV